MKLLSRVRLLVTPWTAAYQAPPSMGFRNAFESVLMRWMNLEPIIQSEVSQEEKDKYCILTHIYGILKNGTDELIYRAAVEKQRE